MDAVFIVSKLAKNTQNALFIKIHVMLCNVFKSTENALSYIY